MNRIVLQLWEESERIHGVRPDGCSMHIDIDSRDSYVSSIYSSRDPYNVPDEYERTLGGPIVAYVNDSMFDVICSDKSIRVGQNQMNNLIEMEDIIIKEE